MQRIEEPGPEAHRVGLVVCGELAVGGVDDRLQELVGRHLPYTRPPVTACCSQIDQTTLPLPVCLLLYRERGPRLNVSVATATTLVQ